MRTSFILGVLVLVLGAPALQADVVYLKGGSKIEGRVKDLGDSYLVENFSVLVNLPKDQVDRVEAGKSAFEEYLSRSAGADPSKPDSHFAFANWCKEQGWKDKYVEELKRTLDIDPDFLPARKAMGFEKYQGHWMTPDEIKFEEGFVKYENRWVRPESAELLKQRDEAREKLTMVNRGMDRLVARMSSPDEKERQAAYEEMIEFGNKFGVMNVEDLASRTKGYYDEKYRVDAMLEQQYVTVTVNAGAADLTQPIRQLQIVQTRDIFGILHTVSIQLPAIALTSSHSTVVVPAGGGS